MAVAVAAVVIAFFGNHLTQAQGTMQSMTTKTERHEIAPGDIVASDNVEFIEQPGRYGLGSELPGSRYALVNGHLVRIDPQTMQLQSILRSDTVASR